MVHRIKVVFAMGNAYMFLLHLPWQMQVMYSAYAMHISYLPWFTQKSENTLSNNVFFARERVVSTTDLTWACNVYGRNWTRPVAHPSNNARCNKGGLVITGQLYAR